MNKFFLLLLILYPLQCNSTVVLNRLFTDNMVLQTRSQYGQRSFIYGQAAGMKILVKIWYPYFVI